MVNYFLEHWLLIYSVILECGIFQLRPILKALSWFERIRWYVQLNPLSYMELENEREQMVCYLQLIKAGGPLEVLRYQMEMWLKLPGAMLQKLPNSKTERLWNQLFCEFDTIANVPIDLKCGESGSLTSPTFPTSRNNISIME